MAKIIGNTTATPNPQPNWTQSDETKADYIKNKPKVFTGDEILELIDEFGGDVQIPADWAQVDSARRDYIKNKPALGTLASKDVISVSDINCDNDDNGKFLRVVNGMAAWVTILSAEDGEF